MDEHLVVQVSIHLLIQVDVHMEKTFFYIKMIMWVYIFLDEMAGYMEYIYLKEIQPFAYTTIHI